MSTPSSSRSLSEIGHLFLSSVRQRQTNGAPMPKRQPPGRAAARLEVSVDLTPEEFEQVCGQAKEPSVTEPSAAAKVSEEETVRFPAVTAIIGAHLGGKQLQRAKEYARHLAGRGQRIGLIEVDSNELRVLCFEKQANSAVPADGQEQAVEERFDPREITESIEELSHDLDRWLLLLPNPRTCEARCLLRDVNHWVLLSTCDHEGVIDGYRALKGLREASHRPRLSLALLDAQGVDDAESIHRKLAGVCQQFLQLGLVAE